LIPIDLKLRPWAANNSWPYKFGWPTSWAKNFWHA
jgi:hypothetical protein